MARFRRFGVAWVLLMVLWACWGSAPEPTSQAGAAEMPSAQIPASPTSVSVAPVPGSGGWRFTNPGGGGAFNALGAGPTGILLAASDLSGAYLSRDGGLTWEAIGSFRGLTVTHVSSLGFDPLDPAVMYLGTEEGLFRSADYGETFTPVLTQGYITAIQWGPQVGYLAWHSRHDVADGVVYRSTDRGLTWQRVSSASLPTGLHILKLLVDPTAAEVVYLLAGEGRFACGPAALYQSRDGGVTWQRLAADLGQVADVALDPRDPATLYLSTYGDVWDPGYRCLHDDPQGGYLYRGRLVADRWTWERLTDAQGLGRRNWILRLDPDDQHALQVVDMDDPAIWATTDGGVTWVQVSRRDQWDPGWTAPYLAYGLNFQGDALTLGVDLSDPDTLLWADGQFLWISRNDGRSFQPLHTDEIAPGHWRSRGVDNIVPFDLALAPDGLHRYLALADLGCFRSDDGGQSWQNCNDPRFVGSWEGYGGNSLTVATDPMRANVVWMTQSGEIELRHTLLRSDDYGMTWQPSQRGLPGGLPAGLSVDPHSPVQARTLFLTVDGDVYRSRDDGRTWQRVLACGGCRTTAVDAQNGALVYAGGEAGLWRSTQGGDPGTWEAVGLAEMSGPVGRAFWERDWVGVAAIRPDPLESGRVYVAVYGPGRGLYVSDDGGVTWTHRLREDFLRDVAVWPTTPRGLMVASSSAFYAGGYEPTSQGIRYSPDDGITWISYNEGLAWPLVTLIRIDLQAPHEVWIGTPGTGYAVRPAPFSP